MAAAFERWVRRAVPRPLRNALRSPAQSFHWWWNARRGPIDLEIRPGWTLKCPRNALGGAFRLQLYDPPQVRELDDFIVLLREAPGASLLDIGSHFGVFSFATIHYGGPQARALAVDPSLLAGDMVQAIARLNGCENRVQFRRAAAGATSGELQMVETGVIGSGYMVLPKDHPESDLTRVSQVTIDELVSAMPAPPKIIKIDVESFELDVLRGGQKTLAGAKVALSVELHNAMLRERGARPEEVIQLLRAYGYSAFLQGGKLLPDGDLFSPEICRFIAR